MVEVTQNGILTLHTTGKVCREDIKVNVNVEGGGSVSLTPYFDGSISGEYVDSGLTTLRHGAFAGCGNLTKISLPNCKEMSGSRHFYQCTRLEVVELPEVNTVAELGYAFFGSIKLQRVSFPKLTTTGATGACFDGCTGLKRVDFPLLSGVTIGNYAFRNCINLETLVIGGATLCPLNNSNVFNGVNTTWKLYVPDNLVESYKKATNWVAHASKIKPISELPEE